MAKSIETIKQSAEQVRNEKQAGANTAARVGGVIADIVDRMKEYPGLNSYQSRLLNDLNFLSIYDVGECNPAAAVEKVLKNDGLCPFIIIHGYKTDGESPYLIIGNSKGIYDGVEWGHDDGSNKYMLPFTSLVLEADKIYVQVNYIAKSVENEDDIYIDETWSGPTLIDLSKAYADLWGQDTYTLEKRLAAVEEKLKKLTASTQA